MALPIDTVLDGPGRDPLLSDEAAAVLKAIYLTNTPRVRSDGRDLTDTEIIDAAHDLVQQGLFRIVADSDTVRLVPTNDAYAVASLNPPNQQTTRMQEKAKAKRRQRRKLFRR